MNKEELKKQYEENLKWIDKYEKVAKTIKDLQIKIKHLEELKREIFENNTEEVVNSFGNYDRLPPFYLALRDYAKDFSPSIEINFKSVFNLKSTYGYFKEKLEEYAGGGLTLIKVVTPIFRENRDRDGDLEIHTKVHHLLVTNERLSDLDKDLRYMSMNHYKNEFLARSGVFVLKETSIWSDYNRETPSYEKLNEIEQCYNFRLNNYINIEKNLLKEPITTKYDKKLDDILIDVFDYSVKIEKLKIIAKDKDLTEKRIKEHEELIKKSESIKKELDGIMELIK